MCPLTRINVRVGLRQILFHKYTARRGRNRTKSIPLNFPKIKIKKLYKSNKSKTCFGKRRNRQIIKKLMDYLRAKRDLLE